MSSNIDIVLLWVDGSDSEWIKQRNKYLGKELSEKEAKAFAKQYRNWDNLQYVFRGIEQFMPWVRKVHFVTNGQKPKWLNTGSSKLNWVKHSDFIPKEYLPTFSSHTIELNMHRIKGLAERFIYLNDDSFITKPTMAADFFALNGLPKDQAVLFRIPSADYDDIFGHFLLNDIGVINRNFDRNTVLKKYKTKFFSPKNGLLAPILSATFLPTNHFPGFMINHMPQAYLKSTFEEVWDKEREVLHKTSLNKFRSITDVNQYVMREWQFVTGKFEPTNLLKEGKYFSIFPKQLETACEAIESGKYRMICINDSEVGDFDQTKFAINSSLHKVLPNRSEFEK